jgi:hypothetical protein
VADLCAGAPCESTRPVDVGDCDGDGAIAINELLTGVGIALGNAALESCAPFDRNGDAAVKVDELLAAVDLELAPLRDPHESLIYTSLTYGDPLILTFDPPRRLAPAGASAAERTLTYCALYDNGYSNPDEVKRNSLVPTNGGPCRPTHCAEGAIGAPCTADAQCDSAAGAGDGACDACTVAFGVTTDDEMFVLTGSLVRD